MAQNSHASDNEPAIECRHGEMYRGVPLRTPDDGASGQGEWGCYASNVVRFQ
ncbi:hypothetical protein Q7O_000442 [Pectobacterium carotovorum subsp. carotovorum PCCS1]|nr:hypothetical protein [Pectobacterium carotovorum subsp. carotovorum PCCS1]